MKTNTTEAKMKTTVTYTEFKMIKGECTNQYRRIELDAIEAIRVADELKQNPNITAVVITAPGGVIIK